MTTPIEDPPVHVLPHTSWVRPTDAASPLGLSARYDVMTPEEAALPALEYQA